MDKFFNRTNMILFWVLIVLCAVVVGSFVVSGNSKNDSVQTSAKVVATQPTEVVYATPDTATVDEATKATQVETTQPETKKATQPATKATEKATKKPTEATETTVAFATAVPAETPADHQAQLDAGYLFAIDNPDTTYKCAQVTLSDSDRDLLERLCMGEFGSGGFKGACLIAQAVKDAMCFDHIYSIPDIISQYHYTGSTDIGTNEECKRAVRYIFDENHDAVQHRLLYMYNPSMVQSAFHESQNYIISYGDVRFFDRWGY